MTLKCLDIQKHIVLILVILFSPLSSQSMASPMPSLNSLAHVSAEQLNRQELLTSIQAYKKALQKVGRLNHADELLKLDALIYPNAWEYQILNKVEKTISANQPLDGVYEEFRQDRKSYEKLTKYGCLQLNFEHPDPIIKNTYRCIHMINAKLVKSLSLYAAKSKVKFALLNASKGWHEARIKVRRFSSSDVQRTGSGQISPTVTQLKPKYPRAVFSAKFASLDLLIPASSLEAKKGLFRLELRYEEFTGPYSNPVLDLRSSSSLLVQNLKLSANASYPLLMPELTTGLKDLITKCKPPQPEK